LRRFQEELADAEQRLHVSLQDISGLERFSSRCSGISAMP
jgi:hypothetical protein